MIQFLGFSDEHFSLVANINILSTGYISPQSYLVSDDLFETFIHTRDDDIFLNTIYNDMFELNRDCYVNDEHDDNVNVIHRPTPI